jgi:hypothetical protein
MGKLIAKGSQLQTHSGTLSQQGIKKNAEFKRLSKRQEWISSIFI